MSSKIGNQGFLRTAWNYFTKVKPARQKLKQEIVGTDSVGNHYVLRPGDKETGIRESRFILPADETAVMYTENLGMGVPQEWDAWLRFRRDDPPTLEELEMNKLKKLKMQERVRELEHKERLEKGEDVHSLDTTTKTNAISTKITQTISGDTTKPRYPVYDDLERVPGEFHARKKE